MSLPIGPLPWPRSIKPLPRAPGNRLSGPPGHIPGSRSGPLPRPPLLISVPGPLGPFPGKPPLWRPKGNSLSGLGPLPKGP
ncbi:unnamed protein product [Cylicostephanus goldi]|uniref:Uncharacterized protein n=1 Tax=Cylicostephanus goldi TaxID=71465 RepID=A0A3P7NIA8_CYLGO|nr:unnamed protein product [Cylicostephanus goldi]